MNNGGTEVYHSINFKIDGKTYNTWDSWRLIPYPRPSVAMPKVRTKYIEIPGMHGQMDISEILTGKPLYENRSGSWEFYISRRPLDNGVVQSWFSLWRIIADTLHGKKGQVWLEDDSEFAYTGRFSLAEKFDAQKDYSKITIEYTLSPWAEYHVDKADANGWLWDPFNFDLDEIDTSVTPHVLVEKEHL